MSWKETCPMQERIEMVHWHRSGRYSVVELAAAFGVSRKTVYKWLGRYAHGGVEGLQERPRSPHRHPNATPAVVVAAVLRAKARHPKWGPAKLHPEPQEPPEITQRWPAVSTRGAVLKRHGLVAVRRTRRRVTPWSQPFQQCHGPNDVWSADFKGWFRTKDGSRCDPLTVSDAFSRVLLGCRVVARPDYSHVRPVFEEIFQEYGLPLAIRTDNGPPFASVAAGGLSPLSIWWIKLDIVPERIRPGHPEQNGRHERLHGTLEREALRPPAPTLRAQQARFNAFRAEYNTQRPHQALGQVPPATLYTPSPRPYPQHLFEPHYPETAAVRRVRHNGEMKWHGQLVFVSQALAGELVALTETEQGWLVRFGPIALGTLRPKMAHLDPLPPFMPVVDWQYWQHQKSVTYVPS